MRLKIAFVLAVVLATLWFAGQMLLMAVYRGKVKRTLGDLVVISERFAALHSGSCQSETSCLQSLSASFANSPFNLDTMRDVFNAPYVVRVLKSREVEALLPGCTIPPSTQPYHLVVWSRGFDGRQDASWRCGIAPPWDSTHNDIVFVNGTRVQEPLEFTTEPSNSFMLRRWLARSPGA